MVYGVEAVLPTNLEYGALRVKAYTEQGNKACLKDTMDQLDEAGDVALLLSAKFQQAMCWYHSRCVRGQAFSISDLVLLLVQSNKNRHKLSPPWEGPHIIAEVLQSGTYKLKDADEQVYSNAWNIE
jgi:hypothetical protein